MKRLFVSNWKGSVNTAELVRKQITARWGVAAADKYDPRSNCLTFTQWLKQGYQVKKGEKAIKSLVVLEEKDEKGNVVRKYPKMVNLFYVCQVEKIG